MPPALCCLSRRGYAFIEPLTLEAAVRRKSMTLGARDLSRDGPIASGQSQKGDHPLNTEIAVSPRDGLAEPVHQFGSEQAYVEASPVQENACPPRAVSAWLDLLVTLLWVVPAIGILAYFVGLIRALAVTCGIILVLALCINSSIGHVIELDRIN